MSTTQQVNYPRVIQRPPPPDREALRHLGEDRALETHVTDTIPDLQLRVVRCGKPSEAFKD